jgi:hypothetical protein
MSGNSFVAQLGKAVQVASTSTRRIKSIMQWNVLFDRFALAGVLVELFDWQWVQTYRTLVNRMAEEQRLLGKVPELVFTYDELQRKDWARRSELQDESLDILKESQTMQEAIWEAAKSRWTGSVGFGGQQMPTASKPNAPVLPISGADVKDEMNLDKDRRKAQQAAQQLAEQSKAQMGRQLAMMAAQSGMGRPEGISNSAWRSATYVVDKQHNRHQNGGGQHGGGGGNRHGNGYGGHGGSKGNKGGGGYKGGNRYNSYGYGGNQKSGGWQ